jgi:hypothetical protein
LIFLRFLIDFTRCWTNLQNKEESFSTGDPETFKILTILPSVHPPRARRRGPARRRRGGARPRKHGRGIVDKAHLRPIGGGGSTGEDSGERRQRNSGGAPAGSSTAVREGPGLNHVLHGELPCDPEKVLGRSRGLEKWRRSELDSGGVAAAAGTRAPANGWLSLNNTQLGEVLWYTGKG